MNKTEILLRNLLRNNVMAFTYRKVNGEIRHAIGTRNLTLAENYTDTRIPTPTGDMQPNSYYDVEKNGWRSWKDGSVISIDGINPTGMVCGFLNTKPNTEKTEPTPVREIPISKPTTGGVSGGKPTDGGADIDNLATNLGLDGLGDFFGGLFGGGFARPSKEEIRKSMDKLDKDIDIVPPMGGGVSGGKPTGGVSGGKVGTPTFTDKGLELEMGISVEDFAKMVAHYAVEEFISRIK